MTVDESTSQGSANVPPLIEHLERYLGEIGRGWPQEAGDGDAALQVVRFPRCAGAGSVAFSTLGLSQHALRSRASGKDVHLELMMCVSGSLSGGTIARLLQHVARELLATHLALLRGDVISLGAPLLEGSPMEALYVSIPVHLPDEFASCAVGEYEVVFAWIVPISASEAAFVRERGWEVFEDRLVERNPDLVDVHRKPMIL